MSRRDRKDKKKQKRYLKLISEHESDKEEAHVKVNKRERNRVIDFYDKNYKKLLIIPILMLVISLAVIGLKIAQTGDFVEKAVSLKGGTTLTLMLSEDVDINALQNSLGSVFPGNDISVRELSEAGVNQGLIIESDIDGSDKRNTDKLIESVIEILDMKITKDDYSLESMGSSLGDSFFRETFIAILIAFLFMGIVVFIYFRTLVPSAAVILAALSDMIVTLAIVNIMGMKLSTAGIAAFLMLIGYSVDTDILLTTKLIKRKEGLVLDRILDAMKTGLTMSITTMAALTIALIFSQSDTLRQIMIIILIGLLVDIINTWIQNAGILRYYIEKSPEKK